MNPILLARHVQDSLRELVHTTLNSSSRAFEGMVERFLDEPANFLKGPWVSVDMPFHQAQGAAEGTWVQPFPQVPLRFAPYKHQMDAFARLSGETMRSTLVATGTGSGKTESYLWPILDHCRKNKGKPGIKAILIYPMNALATDQARRISAAITDSKIPALQGVRAGLYADAEPESPAHEVTPDSVITHRDTMRKSPPDILLTNYKMLDYLLLRGKDKALWDKNDPETLRFLVVDEMHTFDGAQGADLALLLRRLKLRLNTPPGHLICVGSSATLGSGPEAASGLSDYAETIFGEVFDTEAVVRETRKDSKEVFELPDYFDVPSPASVRQALDDAEELDQPGAALRLATCLFSDTDFPDFAFLTQQDPGDANWRLSLGELLLKHLISQRTLSIIAEHKGPASLEHIAAALSQVKPLRGWADDDRHALAELVIALVAWARSGSPDGMRPLFNVRIQVWIREMARMITTLPRLLPDGQRSEIDLIHAHDLDQQALRRTLPIVNCNRCGSVAHVGRLNAGAKTCWAPLDQLYEEFFDDNAGDRIRLFYHEPLDTTVRQGSAVGKVHPGRLDAESLEFVPGGTGPDQSGAGAPVWMYSPYDAEGKIDRTCPACGQTHGLLLFGMRAARLTTGITGTLYTSTQNEERAGAKPRFLMFSDSIQDAAQRAAVAETRNALSVFQKSLYSALATTETQGLTLQEVIEDVPRAYLDAMGPDAFTARFIAKEQTWRKRYQDLVMEGATITDPVFLEHVRLRLGWEYFVDLSYRAHFSHTLELNGMATADVPASRLQSSAERLASEIRNQYPSIPTLDPQVLTTFLAGFVQRMRRQGAIAHPYLVHAVEGGQDRRGLNWFSAAGRMGLGKSRVLPSPDYRKGLAPVPVTLYGSVPDFEKITRSSPTNWYRDWLSRNLDTHDVRLASDFTEIFNMVLNRLTADGILRRVDGPDGSMRSVWLVEPAEITVSTQAFGLSCSHCGKSETALTENHMIAVESPCTKIGCKGRLQPSTGPDRRALRRALLSDRNHRVVAREHTGVLDTNDRLKVEKGFIKEETQWAPNLISATPTLEMGIDIGDLSTLLLSSVPPEEANYVQRMGRSGRRDGNALNLVLANARAHDLQFWEDPTPMISGQVRPPGVFLAAEEVLLRQVTAFTLDVHVAQSQVPVDFGKVSDVLKRRAAQDAVGFPVEWLEMVSTQGSSLAETFVTTLPEEVRKRLDLVERIHDFLTSTGTKSIGWRVGTVFDNAAEERARLMQLRDDATKELEKLRRRKAELTPEEFEQRHDDLLKDRKEINRLIRSGIDDVQVIKFLTDKGLLPNYAFPEEGVKLTSILSRRNDSGRDEDGLLHIEYSRAASSALTEFAPGQYFYANGRQVEIKRIEIGKDDLTSWTFCPSCSHVAKKLESGGIQNCPKCNDEMWADSGANHDVIELRSVLSIDSEEQAAIRDQDQREQRQFDRVLMPFHGPEQIAASWFTSKDTGSPFGFEFIPHCLFRDFNFGQKSARPGPRIAGEQRPSQPFRVCRHCGSLQKPFRETEDRGTHPPSCRVSRDTSLARTDWETDVFLMRKIETEAIRIVIPVVGDADEDDLKSFVAAINLGMRHHFSGKVDHIRSTIYAAQLDGVSTLRSLYLYDSVPGGSGYLRQIAEHPETMRQVIAKAAEALRDCPCNQEPFRNGCFRCVKPYRSQFGPGEPDRDRARQMMEAILEKWDSLTRTEAGIDISVKDALVESALERRFLGALGKLYGDAALTPQVLSGGRRGFVLRAGTKETPKLWTIEPQVQIDARFKGLPKKRIDFLLTPVGQSGQKPLVVEMDGLEYHAGSVGQDLLDRMAMIRSGQVKVWTLSWHDLDDEAEGALNPLTDAAIGPLTGLLARILQQAPFAGHSDAVRALQKASPLGLLKAILNHQIESDFQARSILCRSLIGPGRPFDDLPNHTKLTAEGRLFLKSGEVLGRAADGVLDLFLSSKKLAPPAWLEQDDDLRLIARAELPDVGTSPMNKTLFTEAWRGLWRLVNLFQDVPGFHVEINGLDTLLPPDMAKKPPPPDPATALWEEAMSLTDEAFHSLIQALIAAGLPAPDRIGEDLVVAGRVKGMMEFGWAEANVAIADQDHDGTDWTIIVFEPDTHGVGETVTAVLQAIEKAKA